MNPSPQPGTLGKYTPIASLGKGGMANVYLALMSGPSGFHKLMVVKELRDDVEIARADLVGMFLDEARLAAQLHHRNIVQTYEFGEVDGRCYMAMEYLEGQTLRAAQKRASLPLAEELRALAEIARGLHYAHELRGFDGKPLAVVHRDVSPQNVMLTYDGQVKLLDFGIAKIDGAEHLTKMGAIKGKIDYIAPEQIRAEALDRRADVFSLGAMLWEALTHERFGGGSALQEVQKIHRRLSGGEPSIRERAPGAPAVLLDLVEQSLALDPGARLPSAARFAERIDAYLASLSERPGDHSLATWMAATFEGDRQRLRERVDRQIKRVQERGASASRFTSLPTSAFTDPGSGVLDLSAAGSVSRDVDVGDAPRFPSAAPSPARSALPRRRARKLPIVVGAAVGVAALLALYLPSAQRAEQAEAEGRTPGAEPVALASQQGSVALPAPQTVRFTLRVTPANARVTLDGAPLPELPFAGAYRASSALHHLEASAAGHVTEKQLVTFDVDRAIEIVLLPEAAAPVRAGGRGRTKRPEPTGGGSASAAAEPAPSQPRASELAPGQELKLKPTRQHFDMNDPYAD